MNSKQHAEQSIAKQHEAPQYKGPHGKVTHKIMPGIESSATQCRAEESSVQELETSPDETGGALPDEARARPLTRKGQRTWPELA
eukprot:2712308-Pyramimonas_sp.AAC.1